MRLHHPRHELTTTSSTSHRASTSSRATKPTVNPKNQKIKSKAHPCITMKFPRFSGHLP